MGILDKLFPKKSADPEGRCAVVVVAAGSATRMEGIDKITAPLGGEPLVIHALAPFQESSLVDEIVIVTREDKMVEIGALCSSHGFDKVKRIVKGGDTRTESVWAGVKEVSQGTDFIAIHDGARPFVTKEIVEETIRTAKARSAAAPAIPVKDTIKRAEDGVVTETLDRSRLFAIQTPQIFAAPLIRAGLQKALEEKLSLTDDCAAVERLGCPVALTEGSEENIKITTRQDLILGEAILAARQGY